jgi:hypothetical protein
MSKVAINHGPEPAPCCAMGFVRGQTPRVSAPSVLDVAWAAAQPGHAIALCNRAQWAVHGTVRTGRTTLCHWVAHRFDPLAFD